VILKGLRVTVEPFSARTTALLVLDYQPTILSGFSNAADLVERTRTAVIKAREHQVPVFFVRVAYQPQDYAAASPRNKNYVLLRERTVLADGEAGSAIHPAFRLEAEDAVITKTRIGAFSTTNLANMLRARDIDTLIIAGLSTGGSVLSTVRDAADQDFRIVVLADCCDDRNPDVQRVLMDSVLPSQADVIASDEVWSLIGP
jgi:nicotinamidase-related amidase